MRLPLDKPQDVPWVVGAIFAFIFIASLFSQTATVTVNQTTKVTQPPVGLLTLDGATNFGISRGTGDPNGIITANLGSLYLDLNGQLWLKLSGTGNTGWTDLTLSGGGGETQNYIYNNGLAPPQSGQIRFDSTTYSAVANLFINYTTNDNANIKNYILTRLVNGVALYIQNYSNASQWVTFKITGTPTDNSTYATIPAVYTNSSGTALNNNQRTMVTPEYGSGGVTSFNGRTGAVVPVSGDYSAFYEPALGNPAANGYVLSSTTAGVRSWIAAGTGGGSVSITATAPIVVTPSPLTGTGTISITGYNNANWDTAYATAKTWDGGATGLIAATGRTSLGLVIGTNVQAWDADLDALGALTGTNTIYYRSGTSAWSPVTMGSNMTFSGGVLNATAGGAGTVTSVAVGNLAPLFTSSVANPTTAASITYSLTNTTGGHQFLGNNTGAAGAPSYVQPAFTDISGTATDAQVPDNLTLNAIINLTTNGFVKTSGGLGTLSVDSNTYLTGNQTITLTGDVTGSGTTSIATTVTKRIFSNGSSAQQTGFVGDTYLTGSNVIVPAGTFAVGGTYHCVFDMTKTGAGVSGIVINIRIGTAGSNTDTTVQSFSFGSGTAVADTGTFDVLINVRASGATATIASVARCAHNLAATGLTSTGAAGVAVLSNTTSGTTFNSATATNMGISFQGGVSFAGTANVVQATYTSPQ